VEIIARTVKEIMKSKMIHLGLSEVQSRSNIIHYLNLTFESSDESKLFWERELRHTIHHKYDLDVLKEFEEQSSPSSHSHPVSDSSDSSESHNSSSHHHMSSKWRSAAKVKMERILPNAMCLILARLQKMLWIFWPYYRWSDFMKDPKQFRFVVSLKLKNYLYSHLYDIICMICEIICMILFV
jgi:hypothetical protein